MNTDKYLSMTDAFLIKTGKGEIPDKITRDLRFCMDEQQDRLQKKGLTMSEEYVFDAAAVTGAIEASPKNNRTPFRGVTAYRENPASPGSGWFLCDDRGPGGQQGRGGQLPELRQCHDGVQVGRRVPVLRHTFFHE